MKKSAGWVILVAVVVAVAAAFWWWQGRETPPPVPPPPARVEAPPAPQVTEPEIRHPIEDVQAPKPPEKAPLPPLVASDGAMQEGLAELLGKQPVEQFVNVKDFVRRIVVTVDNLPRKKVSLRFWPVQPTDGRFMTEGAGENVALSAENYRRYTPFVTLVENVDAKKAVAFYVNYYPLFQEAYRDLGYPKRYFNDRLVEAIDNMLAAPEVQGPIKLARPWVMYEFADPDLEARSAGQKVLIRMGPENAARVKAKLREIRRELTGKDLKN